MIRLLGAIIILLLAFVIGLALNSWTHGARSQQQQHPDIYKGVPLDAHLLPLDKRALDEAYHDQLKKLFSVWMTQPKLEPQYFSNGLRIARRAYNEAAAQIARREQELSRQNPDQSK